MCCSAKALSQDVQAGFDAGADDYVAKPFEPFELIERVEQQVVDRAKLHIVD